MTLTDQVVKNIIINRQNKISIFNRQKCYHCAKQNKHNLLSLCNSI